MTQVSEFAKEGVQQFIHCCLKCRRGVTKAKWHNLKLVIAHVGVECSFVDIGIIYSNLMKSLTKIQFGKPLCTT